MATESKGLHGCYSAGCWHLLPPSAPCFILQAPSLKEPKKKSTVLAFSAASLFPTCKNTIFHKQEKENFLSFLSGVQAKGAVCCTPLQDSCFYTLAFSDGEKSPVFSAFIWQMQCCLSSLLSLREVEIYISGHVV